jgi:hypothetical protein
VERRKEERKTDRQTETTAEYGLESMLNFRHGQEFVFATTKISALEVLQLPVPYVSRALLSEIKKTEHEAKC